MKATIYNAEEQGLDAGGFALVAVCERHGAGVGVRSRRAVSTAEFCDDCRVERSASERRRSVRAA